MVGLQLGPSQQPGETLGPLSPSPQETPVLPAVWSQSEQPSSGLLSSEASGLETQAQSAKAARKLLSIFLKEEES